MKTHLKGHKKAKMIDMHVHSTFSDGKDTPEHLITTAIEMGICSLAFCEHIRKESTWFGDYYAEISKLKKKYKKHLRLYCSIEVKVLDLFGNLDIRPEFYKADFVYSAVHRIPCGTNKYLTGQESKFEIKKAWRDAVFSVIKDKKTILAHPFMQAIVYDLNLDTHEAGELIKEIIKYKKPVEINLKYYSPLYMELLKQVAGRVPIFIGSDSHSIEELIMNKNNLKETWINWGSYSNI